MSETFVIDPGPRAGVPVAGTNALFPVHRIYCVGRNYAAHAREMGKDPDREPPFFFMKPADAVVTGGADVPYPPGTKDLHHEIELVVALARGGRDIDPAQALDHVFGYAVGVDLTRRDLQQQAKDLARPWDFGKGFDNSAPLTALTPAAELGHPASGAIWLEVNGQRRQSGDLRDMIWSVPESIAFLSRYYELCPGDLIFTGTPAGVGALSRGDKVRGAIEGLAELVFDIL